MIFLIILFVLILLIFIWFLIEQHLLWVHREEITLSHLPPAFDGTSLLQITDLHHREMGKNKDTEFLYQSSLGRKFLKEKKQKK